MLRERELALRDKERVVLDKDRIIQERDRELEEALQYKEENYSRKLQETHSDYQRRINETHTEYQKRMQDAIDDYSRKLKSLEEAYQKKLNETYALETEQKELLSKLEDLESQLEKANTDNAWLVERLTEFGRENDYLKSQVSTPVKQVPVPVPIKNDQLYKKVWQDIKGTSQALKQFEEARDRLVQHFHTSMQ
jgi:DNA repair exonuclease SbcCD ATPase subunit